MENENNNQSGETANRRLDAFNAAPTIPLAVDLAWQNRGFLKQSFFVAGRGTIASNGQYELTIPGATRSTIVLTSSDVSATMIPAQGGANFGSSTSQFDITNPAGTTFRYTWDGNGTDPNITAARLPVGTRITIFSSNFSAANCNAASRPWFTITASGANYFEIDNPTPGVAEANKTIGTGAITGGPSTGYSMFVEGVSGTEFQFVAFLFTSLFTDN